MECYRNKPTSSSSSTMVNKGFSTQSEKQNQISRKGSKGVKLSKDPQSVAARERRHRISDRFKILQSLVPGGTKMDTVSMLEEAIHYVKFLKEQIWLHQAIITLDLDPSLSTSSSSSNFAPEPVICSTLHPPPQPFEPLSCFNGDDPWLLNASVDY